MIKTTANHRNVRRFGKHFELLEVTDDPVSYVKEEIQKMNGEYRVGMVEYILSTDCNERVERTDDGVSASTELNIGYIFLQYFLIFKELPALLILLSVENGIS